MDKVAIPLNMTHVNEALLKLYTTYHAWGSAKQPKALATNGLIYL